MLSLGLLTLDDKIGVSQGLAVRISLLSAGLWWGAFTIIPVMGLRDLRGAPETVYGDRASRVGGSLKQRPGTFR